MSIAGSSGTEGDDDSITFTVTLDEAANETVTVDYATSDGSAEAGDDYTAKSGTLTFNAGTTSNTISVSITDDSENEGDETFTVTLSNASGANLGTSSATGTIRNRHVEPLTAGFSDMPSEHVGTEFYFDLSFSENVAAGYAKVRDAFSVEGGKANQAKRKTQSSNQNWTIRVKPHGSGSVSITLPATTKLQRGEGHLHRRRPEAEQLDIGNGPRAGADYSKGRMITGVSLAHSRGLGSPCREAQRGRPRQPRLVTNKAHQHQRKNAPARPVRNALRTGRAVHRKRRAHRQEWKVPDQSGLRPKTGNIWRCGTATAIRIIPGHARPTKAGGNSRLEARRIWRATMTRNTWLAILMATALATTIACRASPHDRAN